MIVRVRLVGKSERIKPGRNIQVAIVTDRSVNLEQANPFPEFKVIGAQAVLELFLCGDGDEHSRWVKMCRDFRPKPYLDRGG